MILIIDCGSAKTKEIERIINKYKLYYKTINYKELINIEANIFSACIISGSPVLLTQVETQKEIQRFLFLKTINIPVFGICYGHQIISLVFGGKIHIHQFINKYEKIYLLKNTRYTYAIDNKTLFSENHRESVSVPPQFELIAASNSCNNEMMIHSKKPLFSVQFHPETSGKPGEQLFINFLKIHALL